MKSFKGLTAGRRKGRPEESKQYSRGLILSKEQRGRLECLGGKNYLGKGRSRYLALK